MAHKGVHPAIVTHGGERYVGALVGGFELRFCPADDLPKSHIRKIKGGRAREVIVFIDQQQTVGMRVAGARGEIG